jgi:ankyrin repeat protein
MRYAGRYRMKKPTVVAAILIAFCANLGHSQAVDFNILTKTGTFQQIQAAIKQGVDVNAQDGLGMTPLMFASSANEDPEVITLLLGAGANLSVQSKAGATALMLAAQSNPNPEVINRLLGAGANLEVQNKFGMTALTFAAKYNKNQEIITLLLTAGANAKVKDRFGKTALDYAKDNDKLTGTAAYRALEEAAQ